MTVLTGMTAVQLVEVFPARLEMRLQPGCSDDVALSYMHGSAPATYASSWPLHLCTAWQPRAPWRPGLNIPRSAV